MLAVSVVFLKACGESHKVAEKVNQLGDEPLFVPVPAAKSNIDFINSIVETEENNVFIYEYFYNGGGVAIGDINNDGLEDIYFTANQAPDKLYLNLGNLEFRDITDEANLTDDNSWSTGATFADVNNDGFLDLYVCNATLRGDRRNKLYLNDQNGKFHEQAEAFGVDDQGFSTHASFFDYDKDGDLDMYLVNHSPLRTMPLSVQQKARKDKP
ncbi:MAG: VCBS repeat-containing protein, partial [Bacteroidota bacterium]